VNKVVIAARTGGISASTLFRTATVGEHRLWRQHYDCVLGSRLFIKENQIMTTATASSSPTALESNARPWGFLLIQGIAMVIIGAILLWAPLKTGLRPTCSW
jgi:hypothetical protein